MMANMRNQYPAAGAGVRAAADGMDWSQEISGAMPRPMGQRPAMSAAAPVPVMRQTPLGAAELVDAWPAYGAAPNAQLNMGPALPQDAIQAPTSLEEARVGSMKGILSRNLGNFVVATFLIGTQGTTSWEGVLYDVGNDYLVIYQAGQDRYIVCDIYSLKYIEFYDTRRREMRENILRENGWQENR